MSRTKPLDFTIHGTGRPQEVEYIVTQGVSTIMKRGGYDRTLKDKGGVFEKKYMYGDGLYMVGTNPDDKNKDMPVVFTPISNNNIWIDKYSTAMRSAVNGQQVRKMAIVFTYSWQEAITLYPELEKNGTSGEIPKSDAGMKDLEKTWTQDSEMQDEVEICYYYDLDNYAYVVFGGRSCLILDKKVGEKKYPFFLDGEAYIPVIQDMCMPSLEGFWNHGIGDMLYELAVINQRLLNLELGHVEDNVYPITLVNTPQGKSAEFFKKLQVAHRARAAGSKAFIPMEYSSTEQNQVQAQSLLTQNLSAEWQMMYQKLEQEMSRMGISLDETDRGQNVTATQIMAEEDARNAFVKQSMEYNAPETEFGVRVVMDIIKNFVKKSNKTKLNLTTKLQIEGGDFPLDIITYGMIAEELQKHNYFVKVNSRSGAIPSNTFMQAQIMRMLPMAQPGSKAQIDLMGRLAALNDQDFSGQDFMPAQQPQMPQGGASPEDMENMEAEVTETERLAINPRANAPTPAI